MNTKIGLASDNWSPAHPQVLQAIVDANQGFAPAYGSDAWTEQATELIEREFRTKCRVFFIPTGTGSNVFGLMLCCRRHESVICTDISHVEYQESGAFESIVGCKLLPVPHQFGKLTPSEVQRRLQSERAFGKHGTSPRVLTIAQPTEVGTAYSLDELRALAQLCKAENLLFHVDGSRLYNAVAHLNVDLHEIVAAAKPDVLSLGGTKNGLLGAEALLVVNPALQEGSEYLQKQTLQLLSKMRFVSAQFIPYFKTGLWRTLAQEANQKAQEIAAIIKATPNCTVCYPVDTNQIFFSAPTTWLARIHERIHCLAWDKEKNETRMIASWNTSDEDVRTVREVFAEVTKIAVK